MIPQKAPSCVACGAPVPAVMEVTPFECPFCQRSQILHPPPGEPPVTVPPLVAAPLVARPIAVPEAGRWQVWLAVISALLTLVIGGAIFASRLSEGGASHSGSGPGSGGITPPGERLQWDSRSRPGLIVADINGDGVEDFVGGYHLLDLSTRDATSTMFIGAFDGKTLQRLWPSAPLGTIAQAATATHFGVAAGRVVVTDFRAQAHVLDLKTGKELRLFALSDRARAVCSPGDGRSEVWIDVADEKPVTLDLTSGVATPGPRPGWCAARLATSCAEHAFRGEACAATIEETVALAAKGLIPDMVLRGDGRAFALATKSPGTPVRLLAAFDPKSLAVLWQTPVAPDPALATTSMSTPATLAGGRIYTIYKTTTPAEVHVVAFDAASGKRGLDFKVPRGDEGTEPGALIVSSQRIYVPHWTWLDLFDVRDGRHVETVGMW